MHSRKMQTHDTMLVLAFTETKRDYRVFLKHLALCLTNPKVDVVLFRGSKAKVWQWKNGNIHEDSVKRNEQTMRLWLRQVIDSMTITNTTSVVYYGHKMGWRTQKKISVDVFVEEVLQRIRPKLVCFDSCYMADAYIFIKVRPWTRYVLASPSYHPFTSVIDTPSFARKLPTSNTPHEIWLKYLRTIVNEFNDIQLHRHEPKYTCLLGFDLHVITEQQYNNMLSTAKCNDKEGSYTLPYDHRRYDYISCLGNTSDKTLFKTIAVAHPRNGCAFKTGGVGYSYSI